ncbi:SRPBCC family protein [Inquilinus sp. OTU3971]|uniref:SRPBCC family protein n=1 Tax=Inquilinus sp. OTU3971 TaxID=3043855 RepID=UPI00313B916E
MTEVSVSVAISAPAGRVWSLLGGFDLLPRWLDAVRSSELEDGGRIRRLETVSGDIIVERLLEFSEAQRRYSYAHVESPDPVSGYVGTMSVRDADQGSVVTWSSRFQPQDPGDATIAGQYERFYRTALHHLKALVESGLDRP